MQDHHVPRGESAITPGRPAPTVIDLPASSLSRPGSDRDIGSTPPVVLIVATAFPPDPLSGAARPGRFARYVPQFGYRTIVICRGGSGPTTGPEAVRRVPHEAPGRKVRFLASVGDLVQRYLLPYDDNLPWVAHAMAEAEAVLAHHPVAAVLSTSPPVATHLVALWLKRRHGLPWVADFRDPLWGNPFRTRRWFFPYDAMVEHLLFRRADALIANTDTVAELWHRRHSDVGHKVTVIWNGFDPEDRIGALPPSLGEPRVLAHVGSPYGGRHPGALLASVVRLIRRGGLSAERTCIRLVGPVDEQGLRANQQAMDTLRGWGCLEYDGKQVSPDEARWAASRTDYLLLLDLNEQDADLQVPAKLFEYIRIGGPNLAFTRRDSPTDRILRESGVLCQVVYQGANDAEVDGEVRRLFDLPAEPRSPRAWFEEQFNGRNQTRMLAEILDAERGRPTRYPIQPGPRPLTPGHDGP
jgi:hypothetical protein